MVDSKHKLRPSYSDATPKQLKLICNGVGPSWAPPPVRKLMTSLSCCFYASVRVFGRASFYYGQDYQQL